LKLLQRIRDETHRFAITFHRKQRRSAATHSALDAVAGIGPKRKALLLDAYGSIAAIGDAPVSALSRLPGIPIQVARRVKAALSPARDEKGPPE
jgi:excinuclease ABC subunit C